MWFTLGCVGLGFAMALTGLIVFVDSARRADLLGARYARRNHVMLWAMLLSAIGLVIVGCFQDRYSWFHSVGALVFYFCFIGHSVLLVLQTKVRLEGELDASAARALKQVLVLRAANLMFIFLALAVFIIGWPIMRVVLRRRNTALPPVCQYLISFGLAVSYGSLAHELSKVVLVVSLQGKESFVDHTPSSCAQGWLVTSTAKAALSPPGSPVAASFSQEPPGSARVADDRATPGGVPGPWRVWSDYSSY